MVRDTEINKGWEKSYEIINELIEGILTKFSCVEKLNKPSDKQSLVIFPVGHFVNSMEQTY